MYSVCTLRGNKNVAVAQVVRGTAVIIQNNYDEMYDHQW